MNPDSRVLISGGSGGIGGEIALACAERGAWPIVGFCNHEDRARELLRRCGRGETCRLDLREPLAGAPAVDGLVHCAAAYAPARSLLESSDEVLPDLLEVNLLGPLRLTRAVAAAGGLKRIVFVLSSASFCRGTGSYALSKAAELALCRLLANELAPRGVRVDAIVPGWTATPLAERAAAASGRSLEEVAREHPDGGILAADEVGRLCASLLFDQPDAPPGNMIVWDRRDAAQPVWHPLADRCGAYSARTRRRGAIVASRGSPIRVGNVNM